MAELLKKLSQTNGVSGNEEYIRSVIIEEIEKYADNIEVDSMGNIIAFKRGKYDSRKIAVTANIDEPGFIISGVTDKGYLKFKAVGKIDDRKLVSKRVLIYKRGVKGIIGMKAIHLQTRSERDNVTSHSSLFIDIGAKDKKTALENVCLGDYITFDTEFTVLGKNIKGKALDRAGSCYALINAMKNECKFDTYFCFTVQHEVGARGANIVSHRLDADVVLTISSADTEDMYDCKNTSGSKLGDGIIINCIDRHFLPTGNISFDMAEKAKKKGIKIQLHSMKNHESGAGVMQYGRAGREAISVVLPCRYSHSPVSVMSVEDINSCTEYIDLFLNEIGDMI